MIELIGCTKRFGDLLVVDDLDVSVPTGEVLALLGPSGCGKSTLLRVLAGFETLEAGRVEVGGRPVRGPGADRALVDQGSTLFPWLTLRSNVAWGPREAGRRDALDIADRLLAETGLAEAAHRIPRQLSGGMKQRGSIAQVLAMAPPVLLLDEPFGALDAMTRIRMHEWLRGVLARHPTTVVLVTHDVDEALLLADRVLVLSARPSRIISELTVDLGSERNRATLTSPEFVALKKRILEVLLAEPVIS